MCIGIPGGGPIICCGIIPGMLAAAVAPPAGEDEDAPPSAVSLSSPSRAFFASGLFVDGQVGGGDGSVTISQLNELILSTSVTDRKNYMHQQNEELAALPIYLPNPFDPFRSADGGTPVIPVICKFTSSRPSSAFGTLQKEKSKVTTVRFS
jgi:hypothetical protein